MIHQAALPRQEELPVGWLDHDLSAFLPLQKLVDTAGRVERFQKKYAKVPAAAAKK